MIFSIVQLNDPDPLKWVVIYSIVAMVSIVSNYCIVPKALIWSLIFGYLVFAAMHFSYFVDYLQIEKKTELFGNMVYKKPYLEGTREFLGLIIAVLGMLYQLKKKTK
jgi:hypothetical protein